MKAKAKCWMAKRPGGSLWFQTAGYRKADAKKELLDCFIEHWTWPQLYRNGYRIVRVSVRES